MKTNTLILLVLLLCGCAGLYPPAQGQLQFVKEVDTIQAMKNLNTADTHKSVFVKGYLAAGDGGGGHFYWDATDSTATNTWNVFKGKITGSELATGRWLRLTVDRIDIGDVQITNSSAGVLSVTGTLSLDGDVSALGGTITAEEIRSVGPLVADVTIDGTASAPSFTWQNDRNTGLFRQGADALGFSLGGTERFRMTTGQLLGLAGSAAAPTYSFLLDGNSGFFNSGTDEVSLSLGGSTRATWTTTQLLGMAGNNSTPTFSFVGDPDSGFYNSSANEIRMALGATSRYVWNTTGFHPVSGNAYDLGVTGAGNGWRRGFFETGITLTTQSLTAGQSADGLTLYNPTSATVGVQQFSPTLTYRGSGWKTDATAAAQPVIFRSYLQPIQGAANPSGNLVWQSSINSGAFETVMRLGSAGALSVTNVSGSSLSLGDGSSTDDGNRQIVFRHALNIFEIQTRNNANVQVDSPLLILLNTGAGSKGTSSDIILDTGLVDVQTNLTVRGNANVIGTVTTDQGFFTSGAFGISGRRLLETTGVSTANRISVVLADSVLGESTASISGDDVSVVGNITLGTGGGTPMLIHGTGGPTWTKGNGAPSGSEPDGSFYSRLDGGTGTTFYVRESGAWVAK